MKTILWTGESRMIPGYGMGETGKEKTLPKHMANSYIKQGMAKEVIKRVTNKESK